MPVPTEEELDAVVQVLRRNVDWLASVAQHYAESPYVVLNHKSAKAMRDELTNSVLMLEQGSEALKGAPPHPSTETPNGTAGAG